MSTFVLIRDLLDEIKACMDEASCTYATFVSLGEPPADCNSIVAWLDESIRNPASPDCGTTHRDTVIKVMITRCCAASDSQVEFDHEAEEREAQCFLNDLDLLRSCINCSTGPEGLSCGWVMNQLQADSDKAGGCYSATLDLEISEEECCDPEGA